MTLGSLFSGIDGFGLGFERAGFNLIWQVERDKFCRRVLRSHWPTVHRFADVRKVGAHNLKPVDCITAGVPCQDVSVAGKRAGLAGKRTGLFFEFARILRELRPAWFVFENVPGLLSSNGGRDFAEVLRVLMVECGYGVSWRVLDSRYFGVAQRRRRVFIVGCLGKPCPASILFDSASGERDFAPRRKERARVATPLTHGSGVTGNAPGRRREADENIVAACIQHRIGKGGFTDPVNDNIIAATLLGGGDTEASHGKQLGSDRATLVSAPPDSDGVRDFAGLPKRMDSTRYRALGNAVTVQVVEWIARRIAKEETCF